MVMPPRKKKTPSAFQIVFLQNTAITIPTTGTAEKKKASNSKAIGMGKNIAGPMKF
jgi:hypothetical protein